MCICCNAVGLIKPMSEFTSTELAEANECCLKPSDISWDSLSLDVNAWVKSKFELADDLEDLFDL